jgi:hypothetical protein
MEMRMLAMSCAPDWCPEIRKEWGVATDDLLVMLLKDWAEAELRVELEEEVEQEFLRWRSRPLVLTLSLCSSES